MRLVDTLEFAHRHERLSICKLGQGFERVALTDRFTALPQTNAELYTDLQGSCAQLEEASTSEHVSACRMPSW